MSRRRKRQDQAGFRRRNVGARCLNQLLPQRYRPPLKRNPQRAYLSAVAGSISPDNGREPPVNNTIGRASCVLRLTRFVIRADGRSRPTKAHLRCWQASQEFIGGMAARLARSRRAVKPRSRTAARQRRGALRRRRGPSYPSAAATARQIIVALSRCTNARSA